LVKVLVVWNNQLKAPPPGTNWPNWLRPSVLIDQIDSASPVRIDQIDSASPVQIDKIDSASRYQLTKLTPPPQHESLNLFHLSSRVIMLHLGSSLESWSIARFGPNALSMRLRLNLFSIVFKQNYHRLVIAKWSSVLFYNLILNWWPTLCYETRSHGAVVFQPQCGQRSASLWRWFRRDTIDSAIGQTRTATRHLLYIVSFTFSFFCYSNFPLLYRQFNNRVYFTVSLRLFQLCLHCFFVFTSRFEHFK
jgi:hypothetical protein